MTARDRATMRTVEGVTFRRLRRTDYKTVSKIYANTVQEYLASLEDEGSDPELLRERKSIVLNLPPRVLEFYDHAGSSFVALFDEEAVGFILAQPVRWIDFDDKVLWLEYIAVARGFRYRGVGSALLESVKEFGASHKIRCMFTTLNPNNDASKALLRKAGFEVRDWLTARRAQP